MDEIRPVTTRHLAYIADHAPGDDAFLVELKAAAEAAGIPPIWIGPAQAALHGILLRLGGARRVLDIGTLAGYSAITAARALPADGHVLTLEIDPQRAAFAREWIGRSDVADRIELRVGRAGDLIADLPDATFDAALLDADKASYPAYLQECKRIIRRGGLILADNAFAFGQLFDEAPTDAEAPAMIAFNEHIANTPGLTAVIVPLGDGVWVAVRD